MLEEQKEEVVYYSKKMLHSGLTRGTGGNISIFDRESGYIAVTGSGVDYEMMTTADIVVIDIEGHVIEGRVKPSSEVPMHLACYREREDICAVVHTHSLYATTMACLGEGIDLIHYLIGFAGGKIDCIPFCPIGSEELAERTAAALRKRNAVLLGNHGLMAVGPTLKFAFGTAEESEFVSELYYRTRTLGGGIILQNKDIEPIIQCAKGYLK